MRLLISLYPRFLTLDYKLLIHYLPFALPLYAFYCAYYV